VTRFQKKTRTLKGRKYVRKAGYFPIHYEGGGPQRPNVLNSWVPYKAFVKKRRRKTTLSTKHPNISKGELAKKSYSSSQRKGKGLLSGETNRRPGKNIERILGGWKGGGIKSL